jgi:hypothetical protein
MVLAGRRDDVRVRRYDGAADGALGVIGCDGARNVLPQFAREHLQRPLAGDLPEHALANFAAHAIRNENESRSGQFLDRDGVIIELADVAGPPS